MKSIVFERALWSPTPIPASVLYGDATILTYKLLTIKVGKKRLAVKLLEHEVRADKQVPLLLK
jgi:hypothetical protein